VDDIGGVPRGHLDLLLLATLRRLGEAHGYALVAAVRQASDGAFSPAEGTVYPALHRLERGGALVGRIEADGARGRRVYRLTGAGEVLLAERRRSWQALARAMDAVLDP